MPKFTIDFRFPHRRPDSERPEKLADRIEMDYREVLQKLEDEFQERQQSAKTPDQITQAEYSYMVRRGLCQEAYDDALLRGIEYHDAAEARFAPNLRDPVALAQYEQDNRIIDEYERDVYRICDERSFHLEKGAAVEATDRKYHTQRRDADKAYATAIKEKIEYDDAMKRIRNQAPTRDQYLEPDIEP